jgi:hypothetical protein
LATTADLGPSSLLVPGLQLVRGGCLPHRATRLGANRPDGDWLATAITCCGFEQMCLRVPASRTRSRTPPVRVRGAAHPAVGRPGMSGLVKIPWMGSGGKWPKSWERSLRALTAALSCAASTRNAAWISPCRSRAAGGARYRTFSRTSATPSAGSQRPVAARSHNTRTKPPRPGCPGAGLQPDPGPGAEPGLPVVRHPVRPDPLVAFTPRRSVMGPWPTARSRWSRPRR